MTRVHTIIFVADGATIRIEIYVDELFSAGIWDIDNNRVVSDSKIYSQFRNCTTQKEQRNFFDSLFKVSKTALPSI
jgi:hypothetical protein